MGNLDKVQWEVAPPPDSQYAPDRDNDDDAPDPEPYSLSYWRIDIVVDDGPQAAIFEVKRWTGPAVRAAVDRQLEAYVTYARSAPVTPPLDNERGRELNAAYWSTAFVDPQRGVWCVWADREPGTPATSTSRPGPRLRRRSETAS